MLARRSSQATNVRRHGLFDGKSYALRGTVRCLIPSHNTCPNKGLKPLQLLLIDHRNGGRPGEVPLVRCLRYNETTEFGIMDKRLLKRGGGLRGLSGRTAGGSPVLKKNQIRMGCLCSRTFAKLDNSCIRMLYKFYSNYTFRVFLT